MIPSSRRLTRSVRNRREWYYAGVPDVSVPAATRRWRLSAQTLGSRSQNILMRGTLVAPQLRRRLQGVTDTYVGDRAIEQLRLIEELGREYPHSVSLVQEAISGEPETGNFTCFQYAFGLVDLPDPVRRITSRHSHVFVGSRFAEWLAEGTLETTELNFAHEGDLVLYFQDGEAKHAAKLCGDLCISKWGLGHRWRHGLLEVPENFGSQLRFFRAISGTDAAAAFVAYARQTLGSASVDCILAL